MIAHTKVVGGGQSDQRDVPDVELKKGEAYTYFCTFPGHSALMKGTVHLRLRHWQLARLADLLSSCSSSNSSRSTCFAARAATSAARRCSAVRCWARR